MHDIQSRNQLFMNPPNQLDQSVSPNNDVFFHDDVMNALNESDQDKIRLLATHNLNTEYTRPHPFRVSDLQSQLLPHLQFSR